MKKRFIALLVAIVMTLSAISLTAFTPNIDKGKPEISDALEILKHLAGLPSAVKVMDEPPGIEDALEVLKYLAGLKSVYDEPAVATPTVAPKLCIDCKSPVFDARDNRCVGCLSGVPTTTTPPTTTTTPPTATTPTTTTPIDKTTREIDFQVVEYADIKPSADLGATLRNRRIVIETARSLDELNEIISLNERAGAEKQIFGIDEDFFDDNSIIIIYSLIGGSLPNVMVDSLIKTANIVTIFTESVGVLADGINTDLRITLKTRRIDLEGVNTITIQNKLYAPCQDYWKDPFNHDCPCEELNEEAYNRLMDYLYSIYFINPD